ncbi:MAG: DUF5131 family protein [Bacillota bacterium]
MGATKIEWATHTLNPFVGCAKLSPGCQNCYALGFAVRMAHNTALPDHVRKRYAMTVYKINGKWEWTGQIALFLARIDEMLRWRNPRIVFHGSMGDIFYETISFPLLANLFDTMHSANKHIHLILTKRPERMARFITWYQEMWLGSFKSAWPREYQHIFLGVTVENKAYIWRILELLKIPAAGYFVSHEPALGMVDYPPEFLALGKRAWLIAGGETGPKARPAHPDWFRHDRDQCCVAGTPFFFKSWGAWAPYRDNGPLPPECKYVGLDGNIRVGDWEEETDACMGLVGRKRAGRLLDGREYSELPISL